MLELGMHGICEGEVSDGLPYLDPVFRKENNVKERETISVRELSAQLGI